MRNGFNPHSTAIEELLKHLDKGDDDELGMAMKPKSADLEVMKVEADPSGEESPGMSSGEPKLTDEEIEELIEALQAKLG
jgi:hypothetical protein